MSKKHTKTKSGRSRTSRSNHAENSDTTVVGKNGTIDDGHESISESLTRKIVSKKTPSLLAEETKKAVEDLETEIVNAHRKIAAIVLREEPPTDDLDISQSCVISRKILGNYVTLDWQHCAEIIKMKDTIGKYAKDKKRKRPLNIVLQADPGSGKSHFIRCLAENMQADDVKQVAFNMTTMQYLDDLAKPIEAVRNFKVSDKLPLLFLDEFDAVPDKFPILLPLLWDGELQLGEHYLKVGKVVIVMAGSQGNIKRVMQSAKGMGRGVRDDAGKLPDLLSRINGGDFTIPSLDDDTGGRNRRVDKVCIAVSLLLKRFEWLEIVPWPLLRFVAKVEFRYGVRSITHFIDLIGEISEDARGLEMEQLALPLQDPSSLKDSSLAYHLISEAEDAPSEVIRLWEQMSKHNVPVRIRSEEEQHEPSFGPLRRFLCARN